jgi:hypothetical protein
MASSVSTRSVRRKRQGGEHSVGRPFIVRKTSKTKPLPLHPRRQMARLDRLTKPVQPLCLVHFLGFVKDYFHECVMPQSWEREAASVSRLRDRRLPTPRLRGRRYAPETEASHECLRFSGRLRGKKPALFSGRREDWKRLEKVGRFLQYERPGRLTQPGRALPPTNKPWSAAPAVDQGFSLL